MDKNDIIGTPCELFCLGSFPAITHIDSISGIAGDHIDIKTKPGGVLMFDSTKFHQVLINDNIISSEMIQSNTKGYIIFCRSKLIIFQVQKLLIMF